MDILVHFKRFIFVAVIVVGLLFLGGEGGGFIRLFVAGSCFLFAWGAWENWRDVLDVDDEEDEWDK